MLHTETKAHRIIRYATAAVLILAFVLSFFSCIQETYVPFFPERMEDPYISNESIPMLPGFMRFMLLAAAALLLIGRKWAYIASIVTLVPPMLVALGMKIIYEVFEPIGGLGGYTHAYTLLGKFVVALILLSYAGEVVILATHRKPKGVN